jgi:hypothetical protein
MMADKSKSANSQGTIPPKGVSQAKNSLPETSKKVEGTKRSIPDGTEISTEQEFPEAKELDITAKPPENLAILYIFENYEYGKDKYKMWGRNLYKQLPITQPQEKPNLSLGKHVAEGVHPDKIKTLMTEFSDLNAPLTKWVKSLRKERGEHLCLVIIDYTNFEIPWEMLELSPYESPHQYIGALITTVRWRKVKNTNDDCSDPFLMLQFKEDKCCGKAVAYLDTELKVEEEIKILEELQAKIYKSISQHSIEDFHTHLHCDNADHSFVYISCHGIFENNPYKIALVSGKNKQIELNLDDLRQRRPNRDRISKAIVFMNTCHSAREATNPDFGHSYRKNFVELFLRQGAQGVIGTLGEVKDDVASHFACELMKECSESSPLAVAEILKKLRSKAVENLRKQQTLENFEFFIFAFMYVYYGNPMTVLRLTRQGE